MILNEYDKRLLGSLIGLSHVVYSNPKTENTDQILLKGLQKINHVSNDEMMKTVQNEKYTISPSCKSCEHPCGNSDDYDLDKLDLEEDKIKQMKLRLIEKAIELSFNKNPNILKITQLIAAIGYDMSYEQLEIVLN